MVCFGIEKLGVDVAAAFSDNSRIPSERNSPSINENQRATKPGGPPARRPRTALAP